MLDTIICILVFITGSVFGSFYTLAVYRIPLKKDITHERSFCPNCNHRLEFLDLIPVFSYIFLGGKCRYCKEKIRPRYLLLEVFSGIVFTLFYISLKIDIFRFDINKIAYLAFGVFYISSLFIIGGIEKEKHNIPNSLLIYNLVISFLYIIYLYIVKISIYKYVIYFVFMLFFTIANCFRLRKNAQSYSLQILALILFLAVLTTEEIVVLGIILTLIITALTKIFNLKKQDKCIPIGAYLCFTNIVLLIINNFIVKL